jgi:type IV pilus assembly protein PilA
MQSPPRKKGFPVWAIVLIGVAAFIVVLVPVLAALGIYGTSRYLAAAKTAEAKNTIGAIARSAVAAYEREQFEDGVFGGGNAPTSHRFCGSASPVPASITAVKGMKYMPSAMPGADFNAGDAQTGWPCLKFSMTMPMYYRYQYNKGSGYLVPSIAPGPNGFEVSAQGDTNANGTLSTFARTGTVGPDDTVVVGTTIYIDNEME